MNTDSLIFDSKGLIPVIVQNYMDLNVLMLERMDREALEKTLETKHLYLFSRTLGRAREKGEESGHVFFVEEVIVGCMKDSLLVVVRAAHPACHTGHTSCFHRTIEGETPKTVGRRRDKYRNT